MAITTYTGTLKELGSGVDSVGDRISSTTFSYLEFTDGRVLRNVGVIGGLVGKIDSALDAGAEVELHVMHGGKASDLIVAMRGPDGKAFITDLGTSSLAGYFVVAANLMIGVPLIPFLGIGLVFVWVAWRKWHGLQLVSAAREHLSKLTGAAVV
jgi:hypothetical protein